MNKLAINTLQSCGSFDETGDDQIEDPRGATGCRQHQGAT